METPAVTDVFTVMVNEFDVAGLPLTQAALDVITQEIASPFAIAVLENVVLFVPTFVPFRFH